MIVRRLGEPRSRGATERALRGLAFAVWLAMGVLAVTGVLDWPPAVIIASLSAMPAVLHHTLVNRDED
jgi:hypothetical protein